MRKINTRFQSKGLSLDVEDDGGDKVHANQSLEVPGVPTRKGKELPMEIQTFKNLKVVGRKAYSDPHQGEGGGRCRGQEAGVRTGC